MYVQDVSLQILGSWNVKFWDEWEMQEFVSKINISAKCHMMCLAVAYLICVWRRALKSSTVTLRSILTGATIHELLSIGHIIAQSILTMSVTTQFDIGNLSKPELHCRWCQIADCSKLQWGLPNGRPSSVKMDNNRYGNPWHWKVDW